MGLTALQSLVPGRCITDLPETNLFTAAEKRRVTHYAYGTAYLSTLFCSLRQSSLRAKEARLLAYLSALAGYFDDLIEQPLTIPLHQPSVQQLGEHTDTRGIAAKLLAHITQGLDAEQSPHFYKYLDRVFQAEMAAKCLDLQAVTPEEIEKNSAEKGGASVLLFRSVLSHALSQEEAVAMFEFGALIQISDDIFDLWHDLQNGQNTLATYWATQKNIPLLKNKWEQQLHITQNALRFCPYPIQAIQTSLYVLHYLNSITQVCLAHYLHISDSDGTLPLHDRAKMVVDMAKWRTRIRAGLHLWRIPV